MDDTRRLDRRTFLRVAGVGTLAEIATQGAGASGPGSVSSGEIVVGIDAADDWPGAVERATPPDARVSHENRALGYVVIELPEGASAGLATAAAATDEIAYVEGNHTYRALGARSAPPNDPRYTDQYVPETIGADEAWATTTGSADVTVAIIDQGVAYDHPDLAANVRADPGRDFIGDGDDDPAPVRGGGHGTEVAGIIGAVANNATGIAGLSQSELIVGRALGDEYGMLSTIADAIQWAADEGADVINLSLGSRTDAATMRRALAYANQKGALPIAAGGNEGGAVRYPAANDACLGVSALDQDGRLAYFSNTGPEIGLAAPGVDVLTTALGGGYTRFSGTSAAAPVVSGVAALALSRWDLTGRQLRYHLAATATDIGMSADQQGYGRVDAATAVTRLPKTIAIVGGDERATYEFTVGGRLEAGNYANTEDSVSGTTASGVVHNGLDTYRFSGDLLDFSHHGSVSVTVNGQPTEYGTTTTTADGPAALSGFDAPTDPDGDGHYEDITGDGTVNVVDVQALFANRDDPSVSNSPTAFDFTGDGSVNVVDVQKLFVEAT